MKNSKYSIIRLLSFLSIVACHIFQYFHSSLDAWFNVGVFIFFILSGCLYGKKEIKNPKEWYIKNFKKIMLPYVLLLIIMILVEKFALNNSYSMFKLLGNFIGLQAFSTSIVSLTHTWFLTYILLCYLITPVLSLIFKDKKCDKSLLIGLVAVFIMMQTLQFYGVYNFISLYIFAYVFGYIYSRFDIGKQIYSKKVFISIIALFILSLPFRVIAQYEIISISVIIKYSYYIINCNQMLLGLLIFYALQFLKDDIKYNGLLKYSDKYSYYFYLTHQIFILNSLTLLNVTNNLFINILLVLSATIVSGTALYYLTKLVNKLIDIFKNKTNKIDYLIFVLILIQPFLDLYFINNSISICGFTLPTIIRYMIFGIIFVLYILKTKDYKKILIYGIILLAYLFMQKYTNRAFNSVDANDFNYSIIGDIKYVFVLVFPIILAYITYKIDVKASSFKTAINVISIIITSLIIIPTVFKFAICSYSNDIISVSFIDWFTNPNNNGYMVAASKGLFYNSLISITLLLVLPYVFYELIDSKKHSYLYVLLVLAINISLLMIGTRLSSYGPIIVDIIMIILYILFVTIKKEYKFDLKKLIIILIATGLSLFVFSYSPIISRHSTDTKKKKVETVFKIRDNNKIIKCNNYDNKEGKKYIIQFITENTDNIYVTPDLYKDSYNYKNDPIFWCNIINERTYFEQINNREMEKLILQRVIEIDGKKTDKFFGIGYSRTSNIFNLERDFMYQYYSLGLIGAIITVGMYPLIIMALGIIVLLNFKKKFTLLNCSLVLGICLALFGALYSGNVLGSLGITIIIAYFMGMLAKNVMKGK